MQRINIEIKARCSHPEEIRDLLDKQQAEFIGTDYQTDTYFNVPNYRLKLREGNIENALIHYFRNDQAGPKRSDISLYKTQPRSDLKQVLTAALGVLPRFPNAGASISSKTSNSISMRWNTWALL